MNAPDSDDTARRPVRADRDDLLGSGSAPGRERADAARNRQRVLDAATELFASGDPRAVTMEQIARAAGVGRATLYRRYPDVASIATALLDDHERDLQQRLLCGRPPLGPGAPPAERLAAFFAAMVDLLECFGFLLLARETGPARYAAGAYDFWRVHVAALLREAGVDGAGPRADLLLGAVDPELYRHQRTRLTPAQITAHLDWLAREVLA
ncbi:TetR/AcrR family transcriptional regulator [Aeromicrobium phragmitis]|uniref:TetR/AcrR family transcriptional regulator n=1 Tax=Aeromicrobium phragmitis TaxID=2478914 RepID=A0A3L8PJS9_9ACTN|nr:TetR/AcrR family transcriptional regulator [Aeromicrobium phragmitis]RLV55656.1 TetR/AcrR family transcriptional regulator [Aeromicrobium phragmitis]